MTFDLEVGVGVACDLGYPCAKFRFPRPFGFRVRADVRDIRQTDGRMTDADDRLMPPPPLRGRVHNNAFDANGGELVSATQIRSRNNQVQLHTVDWSSCFLLTFSLPLKIDVNL